MTTRVVLHVGTPKSGTTYLQDVLERNRARLADDGVLVVGRSKADRVHAGMAVRDDHRLDELPPSARDAWRRAVEEMRSWSGHTAVLSYELLAAATRRQATAALADLEGLETHVVVTGRDFARSVSSAWQERLKFGLTTPLEEWLPRSDTGPRVEWGWRTLDPAAVASRWSAGLEPGRVHVVTVPRHRDDPHELWRRFARACGIAAVTVDLETGASNESLGAAAAELLRRVNTVVRAPIEGSAEQARWLRDVLANGILSRLDDEPLGITDEQHAEAQRRADACIETLRASAYDVVGDLEDLRAAPRAGRLPGGVPPERLVEVAVQTVVELLLLVRARSRPGRRSRQPAPPASRPRRALARVLGDDLRAELADAEHRIDELQREVRRLRQLHPRVAMLNDLVQELLLPVQDRDEEAVTEALRSYRKESL